jgi:hypothetical protein
MTGTNGPYPIDASQFVQCLAVAKFTLAQIYQCSYPLTLEPPALL